MRTLPDQQSDLRLPNLSRFLWQATSLLLQKQSDLGLTVCHVCLVYVAGNYITSSEAVRSGSALFI